jgi:glycosyltransferase involved in cell wall biosynthesis
MGMDRAARRLEVDPDSETKAGERTTRILMLAQFYPPFVGGEEHHVRNLSNALAARGHDVCVATLWREGLPEFETDHGVRIYRVRGSMQRIAAIFTDRERQHLPPFPDPEVLWSLRGIIAQERPQIVHAHNWIVHSFTPIKTWSKAKLVVTLHDTSLVCAKQRYEFRRSACTGPKLVKCAECAAGHYGVARGIPIALATRVWGRLERSAVDMFLPVSKAVAEVAQLSRYPTPYRLIPNFISDEPDASRDDAHPELARLPPKGYLLFVGMLGHGKGVEVLLQAYAELGEGAPPLVLIGRPQPDFRATIPPGVHVLQSWPHAAVMKAWTGCSIAVVPSTLLDAFPTVALEAMSVGRPVVASRIGGLPDIVVDGETGLLVPAGDSRALRDAIRWLLENDAERERMGEMARRRVAQFRTERVLPLIEQAYCDVLRCEMAE